MTITITAQDATGSIAANTYATVVEFKAYHDLRLNDYASIAVSGDDSISAALVSAWGYMDMRHPYRGWRKLSTQNTQFPREGLYNNRGDLVTGIPTAAKDAQCEYAFRALSAPLVPDPVQDETGRSVKQRVQKVGTLEDLVTYDKFSRYDLPIYPYPDSLLRLAGLISSDRSVSGGIVVGNTARG